MVSRSDDPRRVVDEFWRVMNTNDFRAASDFLHEEFVLEWPQSGERIRGREHFVAVNEQYPTDGTWYFTVHRTLVDDPEVITEVTVTDGSQTARAITFTTVRDGKIAFQTEYWPDPFEPPSWRSQWVETMVQPEGPAGTWDPKRSP